MVEENKTDSSSFFLEGVLEDYTEWFSRIALSTAYIDQDPLPEDFTLPSSFRDWVKNNQKNRDVSPDVLKALSNSHYTMRVASEKVVISLLESKQPEYKDFVEFKDLYNTFLALVHSQEEIEKKSNSEEADGLKSVSLLKSDLDREMERLARNGNPFVLSLVRIDGFADLQDPNFAFNITKDNIKRSMRPFDDVYYLDDGDFLLTFKHTDTVGGEVAMTRVQRSMLIDIENKDKVTVSCCLAEPVTGEEILDLLGNMKKDLDNHLDEKEIILRFLDVSPLQRFIGTQNKQ